MLLRLSQCASLHFTRVTCRSLRGIVGWEGKQLQLGADRLIQIFAFFGPQHKPKRPRQPHVCTGVNVQDGSPGGGTRLWEGGGWLRAPHGLALTASCVMGGVAFTSFCLGNAKGRDLLYRASLWLLLRSCTFRETGVEQEALILAQTHPFCPLPLDTESQKLPHWTP